MDRPSQPHVVRTWAVDKIRPHVPPPGQNKSAQDKTQRRNPKKGAARRRP
jgi:hypothetical protein